MSFQFRSNHFKKQNFKNMLEWIVKLLLQIEFEMNMYNQNLKSIYKSKFNGLFKIEM
jgi:hypothetical protein